MTDVPIDTEPLFLTVAAECQLGNIGATRLAKAMQHNQSLTNIDLERESQRGNRATGHISLTLME